MSADPLAVHVPGEADFNVYAYVGGMALKAVDPLGLTDGSGGASSVEDERRQGGSEGAAGSEIQSQATEQPDVSDMAVGGFCGSSGIAAMVCGAAITSGDAPIRSEELGDTRWQEAAAGGLVAGAGARAAAPLVSRAIGMARRAGGAVRAATTSAETAALQKSLAREVDAMGEKINRLLRNKRGAIFPKTGGGAGAGEGAGAGAAKETTLTAGKNFKEHFVNHRAAVEKALGIKVGKLKDGGGDALLKALGEGIDNGTFKLAGQGTLKKGGEVMNIYRGNGLTVVTKPGGEWVTALKSGEGLDLAIEMVP